jgi:hypothetical protein
LEADIRDNRIDVALGNDLDERSKLKNSVMSTLKDLNALVSEDSDGDSDLFRLRDLDANLKTSLNRFEKDLNKA